MALTWDESKPDGATQDIPVLDDEIRAHKVADRQMWEVEHNPPSHTSHGKHKEGSAYGLVNTKATIQAIDPTQNRGKIAYATDTEEVVISTGTAWVFIRTSPAPGTMQPWPAASPPTKALLCNGQAVSRTTYANLFAVIGTTFGAGDGSTTFNVPDLRGRAVFGVDGSAEFLAIGTTGGAKTHDHGAATGVEAANAQNYSSGGQNAASEGHTHPISAASSLPPYLAAHWIIWT